MKTRVRLYLAQFFLEWQMFQTKVLMKIKTRLWDNVKKYGRAGQATDDNMAHAHACWIRYKHAIFPLQQWLHQRTLLLRSTYFAGLVKY